MRYMVNPVLCDWSLKADFHSLISGARDDTEEKLVGRKKFSDSVRFFGQEIISLWYKPLCK